jgi:two-component system OmpR family sensor kinase
VATNEFTPDERWRVTIWSFAGLIAALALTFWPVFYQRVVGVTVEDPIFILLVSSALGMNAGVVAGISDIRSERQFQRAQDSRDSLEFLNRLLRHNILNAITVIRGNAELIREDAHSEAIVDRTETIRMRSDQIDELIQNVKVLVKQIERDSPVEPIELTPIIQRELELARETYDDVRIDADVAQGVVVSADPLVSAAIENILTNAVVHNDQEQPEVTVSLTTAVETARLTIADNGPGVPDETKEALVDPGPHGEHGLGLYLANQLINQYGGTLSFEERSPRGTTVTIELPLVSQ